MAMAGQGALANSKAHADLRIAAINTTTATAGSQAETWVGVKIEYYECGDNRLDDLTRYKPLICRTSFVARDKS